VGNELNMCYTEDTGGQASNRAQRLLWQDCKESGNNY